MNSKVGIRSLVILLLLVSAQARAADPAPAPMRWYGVHVTGHQTDESLEQLAAQLPDLARQGINALVLEINYGFEFQSHPELRSGTKPVTHAGARQFATQCATHGIRLIPQFQCLGHQSWKRRTFPLLTKYPELDLTPGAFPDNEGIYCREWDPLNPKVNKIVFALMDELIEAFAARDFHVGLDEVFLLGSEQSPSTRGKDPAQVFAQAVRDYHAHLVGKHQLQMLMWGDRLLDGKATGYGRWEASENGTQSAIDLIPKDIIICDWHYTKRNAYPSVPLFLDKGFCVWPGGWRHVDATTALIQYSQQYGENPKMLGHLFTTWGQTRDFRTFPPLVEGLKLFK